MMHTMFMNPKPSPATSTLSLTPSATPEIMENFADLVNYPSDLSDDSDSESGDEALLLMMKDRVTNCWQSQS